jgi:multiple sugar transport system permease protein
MSPSMSDVAAALPSPPGTPGTVASPGTVKGRGARASRLLGWGFVGPALILLLAMNLFPLVFNIYLSFTNADLSGGLVKTVGTRNYTVLFANARYANALTVTALFVVLSVSTELVLGFVLALALRDHVPGKPVILTILLIPMMLCPVVLSLFWNLILNGNYGVLNQVLAAIHLPQPQWLTDDDLKLVSILLVDVWMWTPFMMLISLAGLNAIPRYIYEAAEIDRASRFMVFRTITLPMCAPLLGLAVLLRATDALKQFDLVMAITGPNDATTQTLSARIYQVVFRDYKVGLGSAYGVVILVAVIAVATIFVRYIDGLNQRQGKLQP